MQNAIPVHGVAVPAQHGCATAPHTTHEPPMHVAPALHVVPQQGIPTVPHALHIPPTHALPAPHMPPAQHASPALPHA
jgi:hypothetical protein